MPETCKIPRCRSQDIDLYYYDKALCAKHWDKYAEDSVRLKKLLKIKEKMSKKQKDIEEVQETTDEN